MLLNIVMIARTNHCLRKVMLNGRFPLVAQGGMGRVARGVAYAS